MEKLKPNAVEEYVVKKDKKEIIIIIKKIHKEKFIKMIYGFVKKLYSIQEKEQE